jgi:hypothetical protein
VKILVQSVYGACYGPRRLVLYTASSETEVVQALFDLIPKLDISTNLQAFKYEETLHEDVYIHLACKNIFETSETTSFDPKKEVCLRVLQGRLFNNLKYEVDIR